VNIVRTVTRKSSNGLKFCWLNVICCICQSNEFEREIKHKIGEAKQGLSQKSEGHGLPRLLPKNRHCLWNCGISNYITKNKCLSTRFKEINKYNMFRGVLRSDGARGDYLIVLPPAKFQYCEM